MDGRIAARLSGVTLRFGAVTALDQVDFGLARGEVHGLLGENGAGKTTLARVLAGLLVPHAGTVEVGGSPVRLRSAADARSRGVAMVHQHFSLVPRFTGFENVTLFDRTAWTGRGAPASGYRDRVEARAGELNLAVELDVAVGRLGVGDRQRIEILKALMGEPQVLLLDEPTAVLAPQEVDGLLAVLEQVARAGTGVVLVAHKLDEVLTAADRVTVLRRGRRVLEGEAIRFSAPELAEAMVGDLGSPSDRFSDKLGVQFVTREERGDRRDGAAGVVDRGEAHAGVGAEHDEAEARARTGADDGEAVARLSGVWAGSGEPPPLRGADLVVRRGEIVGVAGVEGNGQRTLAAVLAGVAKPRTGQAEVPREAGWIPQDRNAEGLVEGFSISENVALALHGSTAWRRGLWLDWRGLEARARALSREMDVRTPGPDAALWTLSGGNQQKVLAGREFLRAACLLIAESPTRGLDVAAARAVRDRIARLARGDERADSVGPPPGVVLISTDLDEILELADRIVVMVRGRVVPVSPYERSAVAIGRLMLAARGTTGKSPETGGEPAAEAELRGEAGDERLDEAGPQRLGAQS